MVELCNDWLLSYFNKDVDSINVVKHFRHSELIVKYYIGLKLVRNRALYKKVMAL